MIVPGIGPKDASVVIIGEAPGTHEAEIGQPFVGRSGKLLTHLLGQVGLIRANCYITNVVKERPPENDISGFINLASRFPIVSDKGQYWLDQLAQELSELNPNVIIPTGNVSLWALTGNRGITKWRGSVLRSTIAGGRTYKVIPTIHPAAALREYLQRYYILHDLQKAVEHSTFPEIPEDNIVYILHPTFEEVMDYLDECFQAPLVAFDIEVSSHGEDKEVSCISFSFEKESAISIPFIAEGQPYFLRPQEEEIWLRIADLLQSPEVRKVGHNLMFDTAFLFAKYGIRPVNLEDTMIAEGIIHPDLRKGLAYVTSWYTNLAYYKDEGKEAFKAQDSKQFWLYNAKDSVALMQAFPLMEEELHRLENWDTYRSQTELIQPLLYMTQHGIRVDFDRLKAKSKELEQEIALKEIELAGIAGFDLNPRSPSQLVTYFYDELGHAPYKDRKTGRPTTDEKALKRLARKGVKEADIILRIREAGKLKSTYLDVKLGDDDRLRGSFNPIGTSTLRLSSSKDIFGVGTNLQNLPPRMRENLIPDEGFVAFEIDLAQAENRVVAYIAPDRRMIEAFEEGKDVHSQTAGLIFGKEPDNIKHLYREWEIRGKPNDELYCPRIGHGNKPFRYWGKEANHAFNYGLHYKSAALRWEIPETDAKFIYEGYHRAYPGVHRMHGWIEDSLRKTRTVSNLFGFRRMFLGRWEDIVKEAYAFVAQSTVAEIINRRGLKPIFYNVGEFGDIRLLNQVHDSVVFELPLNLGWDETAGILRSVVKSLEQPLSFRGRSFVIPAEVTLLKHNFASGVEIPTLSAEALQAAYEGA